MRTGPVVVVAAVAAAILAVTGGIAYAALPNSSSGTTRSDALPFLHTAVSPEVKGVTKRKQAKATCPSGEAVAAGGYLIGGAFQTAKPAPKAVPVAIESVPSVSPSGTLPNEWSVTAVAPSAFAGRWTLRAYALCG